MSVNVFDCSRLTWQVAADVVDLLCVLAGTARTIRVGFIDEDLDTAATAAALLATLLLLPTTTSQHEAIADLNRPPIK